MNCLLEAFQRNSASPTTEPDLGSYFLPTPTIEAARALDSVRSVVSGLKGIGKTAAFRGLSEFEPLPDIVHSLSPKVYSVLLPHTTLRANACAHEFEYEIAVELLNIIVSHGKDLPTQPPASLVREARKHVEGFMDKLKGFGKRFTGLSVLGCGFNLSDPSRPVLSGLQGRQDELQAIETLVKLCDAGITIRLVIDDPEDIFTASRELDDALLGGLWLASARLTERSPRLKVVVLMKTHVSNLVRKRTAELDQHPDSESRITWSQDLLRGLIAKRLHHYCDVAEDKWEGVLLGTKTSAAKQTEFFDKLFGGIRNGPREMLRWLFLAAQHASEAGRSRLTLKDLTAVYRTLSYWSFEVFSASHGEQYPLIGELVRGVFRDKPEAVRTPKELSAHIRRLVGRDPEFQQLLQTPGMQGLTSENIPETLFRAGAVALHGGPDVLLPYMEAYDDDEWRDSGGVSLVPLFVPAVSRM